MAPEPEQVMTANENREATQKPANWLALLRRFLLEPHASVQEIGKKRRAQLLAIITLLLTVAYLSALVAGPPSYVDLVILLIFTTVAYGFSRTPYYQIGTYFFCFGFTAFAYITLLLGTATSYTAAVTSTVHVALLVAS